MHHFIAYINKYGTSISHDMMTPIHKIQTQKNKIQQYMYVSNADIEDDAMVGRCNRRVDREIDPIPIF